jgi:integrase
MSVVRYVGKKGVVWRIKYRDASGRQVMETVGAAADGVTQSEARRVERERKAAVDKGWRRPQQLRFDEYAERWYAECRVRRAWSARTVAQYVSHLRRLRDFFGPMLLGEIRPRDVARFIGEHPLSARTVNKDVSVLHDVLKCAVREELLDRNPAERAERPRIKQREWRILKPQEVARVLKAFEDEQARVMFLTLVLTGVRRDELLDLRWCDVDMLDRVLRVAGS